MADFENPFAVDGERRGPTPTETSLGFPCGPADQRLFNYLFWLLTGQVKSIADTAGVVSTEAGDHTLLRRAVEEMIGAAIATLEPPEDPDLSPFVTINQARARLLFYPEVLNTDGRIIVTSPGTGQVRLPGGVDFLHRGISLLTTAQTDYNTDPSKIYHLRWDKVNGFRLLDLSSVGYNPTALAETSGVFDSSYDDMLVARVVTNSSNVATITNLVNKDRIYVEGEGSQGALNDDSGPLLPSGMVYYNTINLNWARRPHVALRAINDFNINVGDINTLINQGVWPISRYALKTWAQYTGTNDSSVLGWEAWL